MSKNQQIRVEFQVDFEVVDGGDLPDIANRLSALLHNHAERMVGKPEELEASWGGHTYEIRNQRGFHLKGMVKQRGRSEKTPPLLEAPIDKIENRKAVEEKGTSHFQDVARTHGRGHTRRRGFGRS